MKDPATNRYKFSDQIGHLLRRAHQRHVSIFKETVPDEQLTAAQFVVMCAVGDRDSCDVGDIVEVTAIDEPSIRGIVERLKWRELLTADHPSGDSRHLRIALTAGGRSVVDQTVPIAEQISELTFGDLSDDERTTLSRLLRKMIGMGADEG